MIFRSLASLAVRVGGAAASFGFQVLLARLLGPAHLGVYHTASAVAQLVAVIGRRGLDYVLVKHASVSHADRRDGDTRATARAVIRVLLVNTSVLTLLMMAVVLLVGDRWLAEDDAVPAMLVFLLAAVPLALVAILGEALKSVDRPLVSAALQGFAVPALNLAAIAGLGAVVASAAGASWVFLVSTVLAAGVGALAWRVATARTAPEQGHCDIRQMTVEARPFFVAAIASMLSGSADILILSAFGPAEDVGIYAVAARIAVLFVLVSLGINGVVAPLFAQRAADKDDAALRTLTRKACLMTASAGLPLLLAALLAPAWVLGFFGPRFTEGALVLQLVVAGRYVSLVSGPLGHLFQMTGRPEIERNLLVGMTVALAVLAVPLTLSFGATGTAVAACIAWAGLGVARIGAAVSLFKAGFR